MDNLGLAWIIVAIASIIIEGVTLGIATIWFAFGAIAAWISFKLGVSLFTQIVIFLVVSIILLVFTRPIVTKYLKIGKTKTNAESLIGQKAKVLTKISNINNEGTVQINGMVWSARSLYDSEEIQKESIVYVRDIKGVKLIVSKDE